ncbi:MAG: 50S ribosomal protein L30e [Candidatus Bathyarchaeota archaeon]|nr:50S ribosomal protein L30e [Candidatus Bathyarchaeota archaeon]MDI6805586.1 50S ribosomal protein L30e [Candidatus Bathyarchaeia archaeon]
MDVDKAIATAVKTGKVSFGANAALQNAKTGKAKMIILAVNCPTTTREDIEYYCKLSKVPLITYKGSSLDLASVCGKPFTISALSIREPGDSEILELTQSAESEESHGGNE